MARPIPLTPAQVKARQAWCLAARHGERATLTRYAQAASDFPWQDACSVSDLFTSAMSKKGLPALRFLATQPVAIPAEALVKAIARLDTPLFAELLSDRPWPACDKDDYTRLSGEAKALMAALFQHPKGWEVAVANILLAAYAGMSLSPSGEYIPSLLSSFAKLEPIRWRKLGNANDHSFGRLVAGGLRAPEWNDMPSKHPPMGHPLRLAAEKGNVDMIDALVTTTTTPLDPHLLDWLVSGIASRQALSDWKYSPHRIEQALLSVFNRCPASLHMRFIALVQANHSLPQGVHALVEAAALAQSTPLSVRRAPSIRL